eukprot:TRINITY_DN14723_c0_g1_i1.p1 TRINITY_DN14723_c0_g1~~TRINITY_DN14723_c0_g1_i1.p1  ORF type:complete len:472 (+),score=162.57 TRINITY_DN14723_c0_g1_i1:81-1496(+)
MSGEGRATDRDAGYSEVPYFVGDPRAPGHQVGLLAVSDKCSSGRGVVCVENIPKIITPADFLGCVAEQRENIVGLRVLGCRANRAQYLLLLELAHAADAEALRSAHHGRPFSALGAETMFISHLDRAPCAPDGTPLQFTHHTVEEGSVCPICQEALTLQCAAHRTSSSSCDDLYVAAASDRSTAPSSALFTTMCGHTAHLDCFLESNYEAAGCPVCRFNPSDLGHQCAVPSCGEIDPLWMCLVCGHLGCGRYQQGHAEQHYRETSHTYCLDVHSGQVWDYAGDNFIHRLMTNERDMKVVNVPGDSGGGRAAGSGADDLELHERDLQDAKLESKVESVADSYSRLLEVQLDTQNAYYAQLHDAELATQEELRSALRAAEADNTAPPVPPPSHGKSLAKLRKRVAEAAAATAAREEELAQDESLQKQHAVGVPKYRQQLEAMQAMHAKTTAQKKAQLEELNAKIETLMGALCD